MFEDTNGVIGIRKSKDRQYNCQKKKRRKGRTMIYKTLHMKQRMERQAPKLQTGDALRWSERVSSSCCTNDTRRATVKRLEHHLI